MNQKRMSRISIPLGPDLFFTEPIKIMAVKISKEFVRKRKEEKSENFHCLFVRSSMYYLP